MRCVDLIGQPFPTGPLEWNPRTRSDQFPARTRLLLAPQQQSHRPRHRVVTALQSIFTFLRLDARKALLLLYFHNAQRSRLHLAFVRT